MKTLFRILGTAAAVAVTGAAIVALDKILNQKDPLPEDAEQNAEEAAKTAEAYAEAETKASDAANEKAAEEAAPEAPAEEASAPAAPAEGGEKPVFDPEAPNQNPVEAGPAVAPKDESGKFDPTKIAEASDFGDWEEQGCKG